MTYKILNNLPEEFSNNIKKYWNKNKDVLDLQEYTLYDIFYHRVKNTELYNSILENFTIRNKNFEAIPTFAVFFVGPSEIGITQPHKDKERSAALNIPIQVDLENSFFYSNNTGMINWEMWEYKKENFAHYNLEKPCLINTKVTHGYANFSKEVRVICSISYKDEITYEEILKNLPDEWL